jgi:hypothetical protein
MKYALPELAGIAFFVVTGWVALWPARNSLGRARYHLAALPTGLMASIFAAAVSTLTNRPLDILSAFAGAALFAGLLHAAFRLVRQPERDGPRVDVKSFLVAGVAITALTLAFGVARLTTINNDSVMSYWPMGVELARTGALTTHMIATRALLIPAMTAIFATFGSGWAYVIYSMLSMTVVGWVMSTLLDGPLAKLKRSTAWTVVGGAAAALLLEPSFLSHTFFVHSHMISAVYLLGSLTCLWMALPPHESADSAPGMRLHYLMLAGVFAAGLSLARPDGLAYQFVPTACAIAVLTRGQVSGRAVAAYFAPLAAIVAATFGPAYLELGLWISGKASGKRTLLVLAICSLAVIGPWVVQWLNQRVPFKIAGERFSSFFLALTGLALAATFVLSWGTATEAFANAWLNLLAGKGGYFYLWGAVIALLVLSLFTRDALRTGSWTRYAFMSILLFFTIAAVVHAFGHPGRIGYGDSLNRVSFHALPLVVWFVAAVFGRMLAPEKE